MTGFAFWGYGFECDSSSQQVLLLGSVPIITSRPGQSHTGDGRLENPPNVSLLAICDSEEAAGCSALRALRYIWRIKMVLFSALFLRSLVLLPGPFILHRFFILLFIFLVFFLERIEEKNLKSDNMLTMNQQKSPAASLFFLMLFVSLAFSSLE